MSSETKPLRAQVKEIREACKVPGSVVSNIQMDDFLEFTLGAGTDHEENVTVTIPETFPRGIYKVLDRKGMREVGKGELKTIVDRIIVSWAKEHGVEPIPRLVADDDDEPGTASVTRQFSVLSTDDDFLGAAAAAARPIMDTMNAVRGVFGDNAAGVMIQGSGDHTLRFRFDTSFIEEDTANMWGVHHQVPIIVEFKFLSPHFLGTSRRPETDIFQCATRDLSLNLQSEKLKFTLAWQLEQRLKEAMPWPLPGDPKEFFVRLYQRMMEKIRDCTKYCIICDKLLDYQGLKPAVCDNPLCMFSYMQYGLGEDVGLFVQRNPEVVDLLISLTAAAAQGDVKRFNPFPAGVEARIFKEGSRKDVTTVGFMKGPRGDEPDPAKVLAVINKIPAVKDLLLHKSSEDLKEFLDTIDPLCFPLLRWIITSNRTHLELLPPDSQVPEMGTPHQFILRSSTPEKEKLFAAEKAKHGSFPAFHGSAFSNWHCILRTGLRNYSNTEFMSCGAAYGAGIYMATNSGTSFGYAGTTAGWKNSAMVSGSGVCLAICEVVAAGYSPNPYYVVPEENHVSTRLFFVYNGGSSVNVEATSVTLPDMLSLKTKAKGRKGGKGGK